MTIAFALLLRLCALAFAMSSSAATPETSPSLPDNMDVWCTKDVAVRLSTTRTLGGNAVIPGPSRRRSFGKLFHHEIGGRVGCRGKPYEDSTWYYVRGRDRDPSTYSIVLKDWSELCLAAYHFIYKGTPFADTELAYFESYVGRKADLKDTNKMRADLLELERCGALVFPSSQGEPVPLQHATDVDSSVTGLAEDTGSVASVQDHGCDESNTVAIEPYVCAGIMHPKLEQYGMIDHWNTLPRFDLRDGKWYSRQCSPFSGKGQRRGDNTVVFSCPSCYKAYLSIKSKTFPLFWGLIPSGKRSILLPEASAVQAIKLVVAEEVHSEERRKSGRGLVDSLNSSKDLKEIVEVFNLVSTEWVGIESDNVIVAPCCSNSEGCATFVAASSSSYTTQTYRCESCSKNNVAKQKRDGRREGVLQNAADPTKRSRLDQMLQSPQNERIEKRLEAMKKIIAEQQRRIASLEAKLKLESVAVRLDPDDPRDAHGGDHMRALAVILDEFVLQKSDSEAVLNEGLTSEVPSAEDRSLFVDVVLSNIRNFVKQCEGKPTAVRYHPAIMKTAMALAYRSPAGYNKLRDAGFIVAPSYNRIQRKSAQFKGKEGANKRVYENILDLHKKTPTLDALHGILICDEITLRSGLAFNTRNHVIVGFAGDTDIFGNDLSKALACDPTEKADGTQKGGSRDKSEKRTEVPLGKKANVWMFRYGKNQRFHLEYFINDGNLDGAAILAQYNIVVMNLRNIGCKVAGIMCDAGGGNQGWYRLLRRNKLIPDDALISIGDELVYAIHPVDPESPPSMMHCASHIIKSLRNQLYASRTSGTRSLTDKHGHKILWEFFEELLEIARETSDFGLTRMNSACVYGMHQSWTKMNVSYAKRMFAMETVNFALKTFVEKFNATLKEEFPDIEDKHLLKFWTPTEIGDMFRRKSSGEGDHDYLPGDDTDLKVMPTTNPQARGSEWLIGLDWARVRLLRRDVQFIECGSDFRLDNHPDLGAWLGSCEVIAVIGELFNEMLLHKEEHITLENHEAVSKFLNDRLTFFAEWLDAVSKRKTDKNKKTSRLEFFSKETWRHLKILVSGFLAYAKDVLTNDTTLRYIPMLFSNSSILEASFSAMRGLRKDTAQGLQGIQLGLDFLVDSSKDLKGSGYDENDVGHSEAVDLPERRPNEERMKMRQQRQDEWVRLASERRSASTVCSIGPQTRSVNGAESKLDEGIYKLLKRDLGCHYSHLVANDETFVERVRLSFGTEFEHSFDFLLEMDEQHDALFDEFCQLIVWRTGCAIQNVVEQGRHFCFELAIMELMYEANVMQSAFPHISVINPFVRAAVMEWLVAHTKDAYLGQFQAEKTATDGLGELSCYDVQLVMGWALKDLIDRYQREEDTRLSEFLRFFRVLHADVKDDESYCTNFYGDLFRGLNRGGLALLSARIFPWAKKSLELISAILTYDGYIKDKSKSLEKMWHKVLGKDELYDMFLEETASYRDAAEVPISDNEARTVCVEWLSKAFHVRGKIVTQAVRECVEAHDTVQFRSYLKSVCRRKVEVLMVETSKVEEPLVATSKKRERQNKETKGGTKRAKK